MSSVSSIDSNIDVSKSTNNENVDDVSVANGLRPFENICDASFESVAERAKWWQLGLDLVAGNKVGCILMAGGAVC